MTAARARRQRHFQRERLAMAQTPELRFSAACDWFRSSARKLGKRRDGSPVARDRWLNAGADWFTRAAEAIERGEFP